MGLHDRYNRSIAYLRLSLTSACPLRCMYCQSGTTATQPAAEPSLDPQEIAGLVQHLVRRHALQKVRLTGGEPTARGDLLQIVARLRAIPGLRQLVMTTNGLTLAGQAAALAAVGLDRVNISLDTLRPERFHRMTGVDALPRVLDGIAAAVAAGLTPVRLNCVVVRDQNDDELADLLLFAAARGLELRFIELMPLGPLASRWAKRYVPASQMRRRLLPLVRHCSPLARGGMPARRYRLALRDGRVATVGFITAMSSPFCDDCNRIRIASNGAFYPCLMGRPAANLMPALRPTLDAWELDRLLQEGLWHKAPIHPANGRVLMAHIGG